MKDRIKEIRKTVGLTQQAFAERIGVKRNTVASYEIGITGISDVVIKAICREFDVREDWLRNGEGSKFGKTSLDRNDAYQEALEFLQNETNEDIRAIILAFSKMGEKEKTAISTLISGLVEARGSIRPNSEVEDES